MPDRIRLFQSPASKRLIIVREQATETEIIAHGIDLRVARRCLKRYATEATSQKMDLLVIDETIEVRHYRR
jgi:hypothetical protein